MALKFFTLSIVYALLTAFVPSIQDDKGMSMDTFMKKVNRKDTVVLVDFNADWCVPCKKLKPILEQIALEKKGKAVVMIMDMEHNPQIAAYFEVNSLPLMMIYKNNEQLWKHEGFIDKTEILRQINVLE